MGCKPAFYVCALFRFVVVSLYSLGWPGTHCVCIVGGPPIHGSPPSSAHHVLGLEARTTVLCLAFFII